MTTWGDVMAVAITREEARIWTSTTFETGEARVVRAPSEMVRRHHVHPTRHAHELDHDTLDFYEAITAAVGGEGHIVLVGHGQGKANAVLGLVQYWERRHPSVAHRVVGSLDADLESLSDHGVRALVRHWFAEHREFL